MTKITGNMSKLTLTSFIKDNLLDAGFHQVGIARAEKLQRADYLTNWLAGSNHGTMRWMENYPEKRKDITKYFPSARSVVIVAHNYYTDIPHSRSMKKGKISRYAWGRDYHKIIKKTLKGIFNRIKEIQPEVEGRLFVDTAPVQEKLWAQQAGIGWQGKHTNIISREYGSWIFLGGIALNIELEYEQPAIDHCGKCTACIDACPTNALEPYVLDARRCISYLTIENKDKQIPPEFEGKMQNWIFGCDICQDVCPWNRKAIVTNESHYYPEQNNIAPDLEDLSKINEDEFRNRFAKSPVSRTRYKYFSRNVKTVLKNLD